MRISLAYSPDSDDAFMIYALKQKYIETAPFEFDFISDDIQKLNKAALNQVYDISAISIASYPLIAKDYKLIDCGASIGDKFGPALVVANDSDITDIKDLNHLRIAIPGRQTSAFFAASIMLPEFEAVEMLCTEIPAAVASGKVGAGILIHEAQIDYAALGLRKIADLGSMWFEQFALPLPLGGNVIRRSLGHEKIEHLTSLYRESITWGLEHRAEATEYARSKSVYKLNGAMADRYIDMYVNQHSLEFTKPVQSAVELMLMRGASLKLCQSIDNLWG